MKTDDRIVAFSETAAWHADTETLNFTSAELAVAEEDSAAQVPLFRVLHDIHNGAILGRPGKILLDISGIILVILAVSGLVIWLVPWRNRQLPILRHPPGTFFAGAGNTIWNWASGWF